MINDLHIMQDPALRCEAGAQEIDLLGSEIGSEDTQSDSARQSLTDLEWFDQNPGAV